MLLEKNSNNGGEKHFNYIDGEELQQRRNYIVGEELQQWR